MFVRALLRAIAVALTVIAVGGAGTLVVLVIAAPDAVDEFFNPPPTLITVTATPMASPNATQGTPPAVAVQPQASEALAALQDGPEPYQRDAFGQAWADVDRNGCDQKNDARREAMTDITLKPGTHDCVVRSGTLHDPYSGTTITVAPGDMGTLGTDHIVPLAYAWRQGAATWSPETRTQFANDLNNLQVTLQTENASKGDKGPGQWMPTDATYHCTYAQRFITIATTYNLTIAPSDRTALAAALQMCV